MIIDRRDKRLAIDLFGSTSINQQPNPRTRFYGAVIFPFKSHCPESFRKPFRGKEDAALEIPSMRL
jgi:hypothetical protein